jgi:hypothetical protein
VKVQTVEYVSTDDGERFIGRVEGFPTSVLQRLPLDRRVLPSQVDHLLVVIRRDSGATVYVNELRFVARVRAARAIAAGSLVTKDDIVDIDRLEFEGVAIPPDCGVLFLMSVGWRKGLFYDFGPLHPDAPPRSFDPLVSFGQMNAHLLFQERHRISEQTWAKLFAEGWYPFIALGCDLIQEIVSHADARWPLGEFVEKARARVLPLLAQWMEMWKKHPAFAPHIDLLGAALDHFAQGEYAACVALAFPRIEGLLRSYLRLSSGSGKLTDAKLAEIATADTPEASVVIPHRFQAYLTEVYFKHYDPRVGPPEELSRHAVAHGDAPQAAFDMKSAVITVLAIHHLTFAFRAPAYDDAKQ